MFRDMSQVSQHADRPHIINHIAQTQPQPQDSSQAACSTTARALRQTSTSRSNRSAIVVPATSRRPIPSPLQVTHNYRAVSSPDGAKSPTVLLSPQGSSRFPVTPLEQHRLNYSNLDDKPPRPIGSSRTGSLSSAPTTPTSATTAPSRKTSAADEAFEEVKAVAARDALLEEAVRLRQEKRKRSFATSIPSPAASQDVSTLPARNMAPSHAATARSENNVAIHRTASLDSNSSSLSSGNSQSFRQPPYTAQENITPQDISKLIQTAGSPEAAILRLLQEKQSVATHTDQMWRIMEKQRAMIFGLKSDVERAVKEKERYRRKLKEHLAITNAGQSLVTALKQSTTSARADSQSPTTTIITTSSSNIVAGNVPASRKGSDSTDASYFNEQASRSSTPQQPSHSPGRQGPASPRTRSLANSPVDDQSSKLPHGATPTRAASLQHPQPSASSSSSSQTMPTSGQRSATAGKSPHTPGLHSAPQSPLEVQNRAQLGSLDTAKQETYNQSFPTSPQGFSSPKERVNPQSRKAPPAPLHLSQQTTSPRLPSGAAEISDSEYDDDASEDEDRGRQKTRADDDRQREAFVMKEHRSQSKKEDLSNSHSTLPGNASSSGHSTSNAELASSRLEQGQSMASMISHLRSVSGVSDADPAPQIMHTLVTPALMSPGLPMSPRPGDRPMNSPMPRAPKQPLSGIPMSPRDGGMPLSPRAPRGPLPLPQTPLHSASPNPARAEAYQQLNGPALPRLLTPGQSESELELPPPPYNTNSASPGEIYRGLLSEKYPGLLLPPNALPSIYIKVESSRLRPSRNSYMAPRPSEENPVFTLAIFARSDETQLWRVEKSLAALSVFDQQIKVSSGFRTRLPDRGLFTGHAPARIDARRLALGSYFDSLLDTPMNDQAGVVVCGFLTADAFPAEATDYFPRMPELSQPVQASASTVSARKHGYLTKRGKNFGGWKARYFMVEGPQLKYYDAPGGTLLGSIKLAQAQIGKQSMSPQTDEDIDNQYRHAFLILEPKRKDSASHMRHVLCAESDEERDAWVECLLQYVDDEPPSRKASGQLQTPKESAPGGASPRVQKSLNDLNRPSSSGRGSSTQGSLRSVPYDSTVAAEAPVMGVTSLRGHETPSPTSASSPTFNGPGFATTPVFTAPTYGNEHDEDKNPPHPFISGPTNGTVISDLQSWGNKPAVQTPVKDKKRSIFGFGGHNRGRASSDTAAGTIRSHQIVRPVFGVPLVEAVEFAAPLDVPILLPAVAYRCIDYLRVKNATSEEGIFRLSGSNLVIKALRERFNTEGDINLVTDEHQYDVHAVASLLKQYLRELPANILTRELHPEFLRTQEQEEKVKLDACNVLVNRMPAVNRELLEALTAFLREIVDNEKVNKMSVRNVGIVFAPTLNIPATLITLFVMEHYSIFGPPVDSSTIPSFGRRTTDPSLDTGMSPRRPTFFDQPTNDQQPQEASAQRSGYNGTGFVQVQPGYSQGQGPDDSGFGSLNGALAPPPREALAYGDVRGNGPMSKQSRRESSTFFMHGNFANGIQEDSSGTGGKN